MSGENYRRRLRALLRLAGVRRIDDLAEFERAFIHQSYAREHGGESNDRMEFLGDSVLGCIAASWLFERFAGEPEGLLTLRKAAIVNDAQLAQTARRLEFGSLTQLGSGMRAAGGDDNTIRAGRRVRSVRRRALSALRPGEGRARSSLASTSSGSTIRPDALLDAKTRLQHYARSI